MKTLYFCDYILTNSTSRQEQNNKLKIKNRLDNNKTKDKTREKKNCKTTEKQQSFSSIKKFQKKRSNAKEPSNQNTDKTTNIVCRTQPLIISTFVEFIISKENKSNWPCGKRRKKIHIRQSQKRIIKRYSKRFEANS